MALTRFAEGYVLAYLDALCTALRWRDNARIAELLRHPLASALPASVRDEARRIAAAASDDPVAPVHALRLYHQTAHLLGACTDPASRTRDAGATPAASNVPRQIEFDFPVAVRPAAPLIEKAVA